MLANVTKLYLLELYTWKTCVGMIAVLLLAPAVVKLVEKISDWWYWRKRKQLMTKVQLVCYNINVI